MTLLTTDAQAAAQPIAALAPRSPRLMTLLLVGRITGARADLPCRIRNISTGGLMAEVLADFAVAEHVRIELRNGNAVTGSVRWTDGPRLGIQFDTAVDVERLLSEPSMVRRRATAIVPRAPRLPTDCPAEIRIEGRVRRAAMVDLSQGGAKLVTAAPLGKGGLLTLAVPGLDPLRAAVRWVAGDRAGIAFLEAIAFTRLAEWLGDPAIRYARRAA